MSFRLGDIHSVCTIESFNDGCEYLIQLLESELAAFIEKSKLKRVKSKTLKNSKN
jgi:hypothetical protein